MLTDIPIMHMRFKTDMVTMVMRVVHIRHTRQDTV